MPVRGRQGSVAESLDLVTIRLANESNVVALGPTDSRVPIPPQSHDDNRSRAAAESTSMELPKFRIRRLAWRVENSHLERHRTRAQKEPERLKAVRSLYSQRPGIAGG